MIRSTVLRPVDALFLQNILVVWIEENHGLRSPCRFYNDRGNMSSLRNLGNDGRRPDIQNPAVEISISGILGEEEREAEEREAERGRQKRGRQKRGRLKRPGRRKLDYGRLERV